MLQGLRRFGFFAADWLKGSPVSSHLRLIERCFLDATYAENYRTDQLHKLLEHAHRHVPYYQPYTGSPLHAHPVLSKLTAQADPDSFLSTAFNKSKLITRSTSGSCGLPLAFWMTPQQIAQSNAEIISFNRWAGFELGMRFMFFYHLRKLGLHLLSNQVVVDPTRLNDEWMEACVRRIQRGDIRFIVSPPSALEALSIYCSNNKHSLRHAGIAGVVTVSEPLDNSLQVQLEELFGCSVLGRYAAEEQGVIAHQCQYRNYHLNPTRHIVEILDINEDKPVSFGDIGRIILTNVSGMAMPLIRYETGDLASLGTDCPCGRKGLFFKELVGRQVEMVTDTQGGMVMPIAITGIIKRTPGVLQFQFVQHTCSSYEVKLRVVDGFGNEGTLRENLTKVLGSDATLKVSYVQGISPLPSGKRPLVLNHVRGSQR